MGKELEKEVFEQCPICEEDTFKYDPQLGANRCYNEMCRWNDKIGIACDVPMSFLEYCLLHAKPGRHKEYIEKVIEETRKVNEKYSLV